MRTSLETRSEKDLMVLANRPFDVHNDHDRAISAFIPWAPVHVYSTEPEPSFLLNAMYSQKELHVVSRRHIRSIKSLLLGECFF
jgi:hypothetical protein